MDDPGETDVFAEALAASQPEARVAHGFAARAVSVHLDARRGARSPWAARGAWGACAVAASLLVALGWSRREQTGSLDAPSAAASPTTVALGGRARVVVEPGTSLRWRVGGVLPGGVDRVELARGVAFFRVDRGRAFEVVTPSGVVTVTGTCFRVASDDARTSSEGVWAMSNRASRVRWFGAGAASVVLAVTVYEGGVRVARADDPGRGVQLAAGQTATMDRGGEVSRALAERAGAAPQAEGLSAESAGNIQADRVEVERLRALLVAHGIEPTTGGAATVVASAAAPTAAAVQPGDGGGHVRGLENRGDTDLTPDEWRTLAERGELRFRLPGGQRDAATIGPATAQAVGLSTDDVAESNRVLARDNDQLTQQLRVLYREATGDDPGALSPMSIQTEIRDKTPEATVAEVNHELAFERGGLAVAPPPRADASPYERMMRLLIGYEAQVLADLTNVVGPSQAHDLLWGDNPINAHSFGMNAHPPSTP